MTRADSGVRLLDEDAIGTDGLIAVMLKDNRFARQTGKSERQQRRAGEMEDVCFSD